MKHIGRHGDNDRSGVSKDILTALRAEGGEGLIIGLENETLAPTWEALDALQRLSPDDAPWTLERDGSLGERGVETVFQPSRTPMNNYLDWLICAKAAGIKSGTALRYGCHISVDASCFTPLQGTLFASLINGWRDIGEVVGGREDNRWARYGIDRPTQFSYAGEKYKACSRRSYERFECRLFRSTMMICRMRRYLNYVQAVAGVARVDTSTLITYLRQGQRGSQGELSRERWTGYPAWLQKSKSLLKRHCSRDLIDKIGGLL
jgi:hypothetical protein